MEPSEEGIIRQPIEDEMRDSYIDYAMSVIVGRALPDVRDGLKPVHRRILYAMSEMGLTADSSHRKSARVVGEVLGKFHPHGDSAVYDALVRMAQPFSLRYPLVDGLGNFGSLDGDAAAAMRYTEARLTPIAKELLVDIDEDTVDFTDNFDGSLEEPQVLPGKLPNLLLNGSSGIAVGMATNVPPHQLGELVDGITALIEDPDITTRELMEHIPGPDFPTGGVIQGREGIVKAYETGRGSIRIRAKTSIEERDRGGPRIVVDEIPYMVNKSKLLEDMAELVKEGKVEEIADLRDESDRDGLRVVIELKKGSIPDVVLNKLYSHTQLQHTFGVGTLAIVDGEPERMSLKEVLERYLEHRQEVVRRRTEHRLENARDRAHVLEGLVTATDNLDDVIALIRSSEDASAAREALQADYDLSRDQADAILDTRLQRLTSLAIEEIHEELDELRADIERYEEILGDPEEVRAIIERELQELRDEYDDERRTDIVEEEGDLLVEDLIPDEQVVVMLTDDGYVKRMPIDEYRTQHRGGRGLQGMKTKEDDHVQDVFTTTNHTKVLFITETGTVFSKKAFKIPEGSRRSQGTPLVNVIERLDPDTGIQAAIPVEDFAEDRYLLFATRQGKVKKTPLTEYETIYVDGKIALTLEEGDHLVGCAVTDGDADIMLVKNLGRGVRFNEKQVRPMGRRAAGVKGTELRGDEEVISLVRVRDPDADLLTVTANGKAKRTPYDAFNLKNRGILGVYTHEVNETTGEVVTALEAQPEDQILTTSREGVVIRTECGEIRRIKTPKSQGVYLQRVEGDDEIVAVAHLSPDEQGGDDEDEEAEDATDEGTEPDDEAPDAADAEE
jgi:DNA gyrase subunit A